MKKQTITTHVPDPVEAKVDAMMSIDAEPSQALDIFAGQTSFINDVVSAPLLPSTKKVAEPIVAAPDAAAPPPVISAPVLTSETIEISPLHIDTPQTDAAIADIVAQEADEVLAAQDAGIEAAMEASNNTIVQPERRSHPIFWFGILLLVIIAIAAAWILVSPGLSPSFLQ